MQKWLPAGTAICSDARERILSQRKALPRVPVNVLILLRFSTLPAITRSAVTAYISEDHSRTAHLTEPVQHMSIVAVGVRRTTGRYAQVAILAQNERWRLTMSEGSTKIPTKTMSRSTKHRYLFAKNRALGNFTARRQYCLTSCGNVRAYSYNTAAAHMCVNARRRDEQKGNSPVTAIDIKLWSVSRYWSTSYWMLLLTRCR